MPAPYMVERFNALAARNAFDFEAWFNERQEGDRSWEVDETTWRFRHRYLPTTRIFGRAQHWPLPVLGGRPDLLLSLYAEPAFVAGWVIARLRGIRTGFRVLKTNDSWVARKRIKEAVKQFMFRRVDAIETPGVDGRNYAISCGARPDRIFLATHSVDVEHFRMVREQTWRDRQKYRDQLGLQGVTFIYVGRFWWGKGLKHLLDAFQMTQKGSSVPVSLLLVGDGPQEAELRAACAARGLRNVVFAGFMQKPELPRYYALADVFVFPTLGDPYGLVVNEAMACSLPVISTSSAGDITDRVREGVNGYIVPPGSGRALADRMILFATQPDMGARMGRASYEIVKSRTPDKWATDFEILVHAVLQRA